jgi:hypothetical protein
MMIARLRSQPQSIRQLRPDVPETVEKALTKALQTDPDDRFITAIEFAEAVTGSAAAPNGFFGKLKEKFS